MKKALVFAGQGTHKRGMSLHLIADRESRPALACRQIDHNLRDKCGLSILELIRDNPPLCEVPRSYFTSRSGTETSSVVTDDQLLPSNVIPVRDRKGIVRICERSKGAGVLGLTYIAQPAVLTSQMIAWSKYLEDLRADSISSAGFSVVAGHSLGEFSALAALGVFKMEAAAELVTQRGLVMDDALRLGTSQRVFDIHMYACNPVRAQLHHLVRPVCDGGDVTAEDGRASAQLVDGGGKDSTRSVDAFLLIVELIGSAVKNTKSFLEVVNFNVPDEQYVVAGDCAALAVLGKCLDPQYRANNLNCDSVQTLVSSAMLSLAVDRTESPELLDKEKVDAPPAPDWVGSRRRNLGKVQHYRHSSTPDDGRTAPLNRLTNLTLDDDGRSGLKKKSWFVPLSGIDTPFHSSHLRRAMDNFHPIVVDYLARSGRSEDDLRQIFNRTKWVTNLTGSVFKPDDASFRELCADHLESCNIGEQPRNGKYESVLTKKLGSICRTGSVHDLLGAVLAAQLAHSVQWIESMRTIVKAEGATTIVEVSPTRTLCQMFQRAQLDENLSLLCIPT